jgi:hypothetical protein
MNTYIQIYIYIYIQVIIVDEMNDYYDVRLKQANLEYLFNKYDDRCTIYRGDICDVDFIGVYLYIYMYIYICLYVYIQTCVCIHMYISICICTCVYLINMMTYALYTGETYVMYLHINVYIYIYICIYVCISSNPQVMCSREKDRHMCVI